MSGLTLNLEPIINEAIDKKMKDFDVEGQISELLTEVASKAQKILTIKLDGEDGDGRKFPLVHKQFEDLLQVGSIKGVNTLLTGGAGLAKSTAVEQMAEAFKLEMASISFSNQTTKTDLLGFVDANGIYRKSGFVDAFENGKVFLADEMDACSANVLVLLNSAISNGFIETPDAKVIRVHDSFRFVGTANTNLRGAKDGFTARNKLDSATIDRFAVIEWTLDLELEEKITNNDGWLKIVRKCRITAEEQLEGVVITPRSAYDGAKLLRAGVDVDKVIRMTIIKAMGEDEEKTLLKSITANMKSQATKDSGTKVEKKEKTKIEQMQDVVEEDLVEIDIDDVKTFKQDIVEDKSSDDFDW